MNSFIENAQMLSAKQPYTVRGKINANAQVSLFGKKSVSSSHLLKYAREMSFAIERRRIESLPCSLLTDAVVLALGIQVLQSLICGDV